MVKNAGTHPSALSQVHDVETAVTFSVSCLFQTKALSSAMRLTRFSCALVMGSFLLSRMDYTSDEEEWADFLGQLCL